MLTILRERAAREPREPAVTFVSDFTDLRCEVRTRAELDLLSRSIASWLQALFPATGKGEFSLSEKDGLSSSPGGGFPLSERVLLLYPPGVEFAAAFSACVYAGFIAIPAPMPGRYRHERRRLASIARDAGVRVILTQESGLADVEKWVAEEGITAVVHATDTENGDPDAWREPETVPERLALLQYTSGSTGTPKGVMVTDRNLVANTKVVETCLGLDERSRYGSWIPLYHDMGLIGMMLPGILLGRGYVQMDPMSFLRRPVNWLRMMDELDVNGTAAPDFGYDLCVRRVTDEQLARLDLSRVAAAVDGSEPVRAETVRRFTERFAPAGFRPQSFLPMYGMAEATLLVSGAPHRLPVRTDVDEAALEQGILRPAAHLAPTRTLTGCGPDNGSTAVIVDPDSHEALPEGRIGEIWLSGPCVAAGYWGNEEATEAAFHARTTDGRGPFLRTGDLGGFLGGDLYVTGRRKDVLVLHGRNLYPQDIEDELRAHHEELDGLHGAVFMVGDADGLAAEPSVVLVHEIRAHWGAERLAEIAVQMKQTAAREFGVPIGAVALVRPAGVGRTTSGKVQRSAMRAQYVAGELPTLHLNEDPRLTEALAARRVSTP
ncbi:fatty acyl-AMP ligase [Streptomyces sp. NPDC091279]|uniref:fatty acyl-AMP ligase n=1 Tax=unclassified Streptomyces TaxID=2593676 RepID=UPI0038106E89